jgi:ATP-dependent Zn protease
MKLSVNFALSSHLMGEVVFIFFIFFKTCIARFSLRGGEQSGNKANNRGKHKAQEQKDKRHTKQN